MTYPGNPALSPEVQQRIQGTFEHTLGLATGGSHQEALLGCDFVLRMDPHFEPARRLQERLAAGGAVAVDDLWATLKGQPAPASPGATPASSAALHLGGLGPDDGLDLDGLDLELPPELPTGPLEPAAPGNLRSELAALLQQRRFQELITRAQEVSAAVAADPELGRLVSLAQERMEAAPYVNRFLAAAREAQDRGEREEAARLAEKARSLDPSHPGLGGEAGGGQPAHELLFTVEDMAGPGPGGALPGVGGVLGGGGGARQGGDPETERRIRQLLDEGQAALDAGDPQAAIDSWSRIFLIDIDHQEASRRIEQARRTKAENERQVEEIYHDAMGLLERGDIASARQSFERILKLQPGHLASREYLQQIDAGTVPLPASAARSAARAVPGFRQPGQAGDTGGPMPALRPAALPEIPSQSADHTDDDLKEEILVPPDLQGAARGYAGSAGAAARSADSRQGRGGRLQVSRSASRKFLIVGSAVLLLVAAVILFVYQRREQWFPNSQADEAQPPVAATASDDPIARARRLRGSGKTAMAIAQLRHIPAADPHYQEAQKLLAQWEAQTTTQAPGAQRPPAQAAGGAQAAGSATTALGGPQQTAQLPTAPGAANAADIANGGAAAASSAQRETLLAEARKAYGGHSYFRALRGFEEAAKLQQLTGPDSVQLADAQQRLAPLARQIDLFRQHEWELALPDLWRMHESDPSNQDVTHLIADSYYDLALRELQRSDPTKAAANLREALNLSSGDKVLQRQLAFAQTYQERQPDLLYHIYIKHLPLR